jgi:hypothetical protein
MRNTMNTQKHPEHYILSKEDRDLIIDRLTSLKTELSTRGIPLFQGGDEIRTTISILKKIQPVNNHDNDLVIFKSEKVVEKAIHSVQVRKQAGKYDFIDVDETQAAVLNALETFRKEQAGEA